MPADPALAAAPEIETSAVDECPVCGGGAFAEVAYGYDYELATCRNRWTFVACDRCGHVWLNPRPALAALATIYPPDYYAYTYRDTISPVALRAKDALDARKLAAILRTSSRPPASFLDVGCGDGRFLRLMERRGLARAACFGLELDEAAVGRLADDGYSVFHGRVEDTDRLPESGIDLATMFHVIEHVDDPGRVLERLGGWLSTDGLLALETPNIASLDRRLFAETYWGGYHIPRHWNLFSPETIRRLLERTGFEVLHIGFQTGHSFWMYSLHHRLRFGEPPRPRLARLFDPLRSPVPLAAFTAFDMARSRLGARTSAMLVLARKRARP